jgi:hypothetical protein
MAYLSDDEIGQAQELRLSVEKECNKVGQENEGFAPQLREPHATTHCDGTVLEWVEDF